MIEKVTKKGIEVKVRGKGGKKELLAARKVHP